MRLFYQCAGLILLLGSFSTFINYIDFMAPIIIGSYIPFDLFNLFVCLMIVTISFYPIGYFYQKRITKNVRYKYIFSLNIISHVLIIPSYFGIITGLFYIGFNLPLTVRQLTEIYKLLDVVIIIFLVMSLYLFVHLGRITAFLEKGMKPVEDAIMQEIADAENAKNK